MFGFKFLYFIILTLNLNKSNGQISDKRLCVDEKCQEPVSLARTLLTYSSPDSRILSFPVNAEVKIFSKEAGSRADLWGAEINGKRGYVPKKYVRELKMYNVPTLLVDTDFKDSSEVPSVKLMVQPDSVKQPYEVIVGTTVYKVETMDHSTSGTPSLTEEPVSDAKLDNEHKEGGVQGVLSSIKSWVSEGIESAMKDNGEDVMDEDDDDFEIDDEDEDTAVDKVITNSEFSKKESQSATNDLKEKFENQMILKVQDDSIRSLKETIEKQKLPEVPVDTQILGEDINPEIIDSEDNGTKLEKKENKQPAQSDYVLDRKEEHTDKQEQIEIAKATNENKATKSTDQSTTSLVNANMEVTTPSFFLDSIAPSSIFKEAVAQNPLENSQESQVSNIPDKDHKSAEVHSTLTDQESKNEGANTVFPDEMNTKTIESKEKIEKSSTEGETTPGNVSPSIDKLEKLGEIENKEFTLDQNLNNKVDKSGEIIHLVQIEPETSQESQDTEEPPQLSPLGGLFIAFKSSHDVVKDLNDNTLDSSESKHVNEPSNSFGSDTSDISHTTEDTYSHVNTDQTVGSGLSILGTRHLLSDDKSKQGSQEVLSDNKLAEENNDIESKDADTSTVNNDGTDVISSNNLSSKNEKETDKEKDDTEQNIPGMQENIKKENKNDHITENTKIPHQEKVMDIGKMGDNRVEQEILTLQDEVKEDSVTKSRDSSENLPEESSGFFVTFMSWFGMCDSKTETQLETYNHPQSKAEEILENACENQPHKDTNLDHCDANSYSYFNFNSDMFLYLVTSAISCIMFLVIYMAFDRSKKEAPLIARINKLEKELLVALKENEMLQDKNGATEVPEEVIEEFKNQLSEMQATRDHIKLQVMELEMQIKKKDEQIESLEKELETSTEVGMELNRIISEMLDPTNGNDRLKENFDQLQRQLLEQKDTISTMTQSLTAKVADNTRLQTELEASQKIAADAQEQLNKLLEKMIQLEKDKDSQCSMFQGEMGVLQRKVEESVNREEEFTKEIQVLKVQISEVQRQYELKVKEYSMLRENVNNIKSLKQGHNLQMLLDSTEASAQLEQLKTENERFSVQLQQEQISKANAEQKWRTALEAIGDLQRKYELADKEKTEVNMKLEVLNTYFKKRETELQEEVIKYKSIFDAKKGEATSTTERIKLMQEEIENYKSQNEMLKQEIISQEIDLKSQISLLEKKVHENWLMARQTERKLEEARQEAAQLRNRLTLREIAINEERIQNRLQSPVTIDHHQHHGLHQQNGDALSPAPPTMSPPPPLFGAPSAASPPLPVGGLPHPPFLPPPFMPPPPMPFMPPPPPPGPPGDRRPPPLGRMSSPPPPLNNRYSPDTSAFSPYDRYSPSPPYDSEYGASPPPLRAYSPFSREDRRDATSGKRAPHNRTSRHMKGGVTSSGSEHSNDSVDKINRKQTKMV